nr:phosphatidylcholine transfer protein [Hymenolepis microstoma]
MTTHVGEVNIPSDQDFEYFVNLAKDEKGWSRSYTSKGKALPISAFTRVIDGNDIKAMKVESVFTGVSAINVYESLQDPEYRRTWDDAMKEGSRICYVSPNSEIGYYRLKSPFGLKDRDFVNQRSWHSDGSVYVIMNHSVVHKKMPQIEGVVRGISCITGYLIKSIGTDSCEFTYITHSDPRGKIPTWVVNTTVKTFAPLMTKRLYEAACGYATWKASHNPDFKPWCNFSQLQTFPKLDPADVGMLNASSVSVISDDVEVPDRGIISPPSSDSSPSLNDYENAIKVDPVKL